LGLLLDFGQSQSIAQKRFARIALDFRKILKKFQDLGAKLVLIELIPGELSLATNHENIFILFWMCLTFYGI